MLYRFAADAVLLIHFLFIVFVVVGGFLVWRWRRLFWLHLPAAIWGALIAFMGWLCPLTPLENSLRRRAGEQAYEGSFIEHYLLPVVYPGGLTPAVQALLGASVIVINVVAYGWLLARRRRSGSRGEDR